jgi:hypothetical protein
VAVSLGVMLVTAWLPHRLVERSLGPLLKRGLTHSFARARSDGPLGAGS